MQSKRRRTKAQIDADKEQAAEQEQANAAKLAQFAELRQEIAGLKALNENNAAAYDQLCGLIQRGHVVRNEDGTCSVPLAEQQQMAAQDLNQ